MTVQESYTIRDAAKKVEVEPHVLRYWEEELGLRIGRNDQGHRLYTEGDVELFERIKNWKKQGLQLKAIRLMLSEGGKLSVPREVVRQAQSMVERADGGVDSGTDGNANGGADSGTDGDADGGAQKASDRSAAGGPAAGASAAGDVPAAGDVQAPAGLQTGEAGSVEAILLDERSSRAAKLQFLLENLVSRAVRENNAAVLKELDYQFRQMEENAQAREQRHREREEEHYRRLDELICQKGRRGKRKRRL
ncbi:MAG: MerR family transcriptional regulator [Eubacteriales bacterium]|nr:MerR family transcriptional regulator [Eubacteriales bacterium]